MLRLLIPFSIGILFFSFSEAWLSIDQLKYTSLASLLLVGFVSLLNERLENYKWRWIFGFTLSIFLFFLGGSIFRLNRLVNQADTSYYDKVYTVLAEVEEVSRKKTAVSTKLFLKTLAIKQDSSWEQKKLNVLAYYTGADSIQEGDYVRIQSQLLDHPKPKNPGEFDYREYLKAAGIHYRVYVNHLLISHADESFLFSASEIRKKMLSFFKGAGVEEKQLATLNAIFLGDKSQLEPETQAAFVSAGAMHILAVSGLHLGIIYLLINLCLKKLGDKGFRGLIKAVSELTFIWLFAFMTGFSPSIQRAACMFSLIILARVLQRQSSIFNTISAAALILLLINPQLLFDIGFQLSFSAVFGILLIHPPLYNLWLPKSLLLDKIWSLSLVSIAAQIGTLPISIYYFHKFPSYFLFSNLFVIPLAFVIVALATIVVILMFAFNWSFFLGKVLNASIWCLDQLVLFVHKLPYAVINDIWINSVEVIALLSIITLFIQLLYSSRYLVLLSFLASIFCFSLLRVMRVYKAKKQVFVCSYDFQNMDVYAFVKGISAEVFYSKDSLNLFQYQIVQEHLQSIEAKQIITQPIGREFDKQLTELDANSIIWTQSEKYALFEIESNLFIYPKSSSLKSFKEIELISSYDVEWLLTSEGVDNQDGSRYRFYDVTPD